MAHHLRPCPASPAAPPHHPTPYASMANMRLPVTCAPSRPAPCRPAVQSEGCGAPHPRVRQHRRQAQVPQSRKWVHTQHGRSHTSQHIAHASVSDDCFCRHPASGARPSCHHFTRMFALQSTKLPADALHTICLHGTGCMDCVPCVPPAMNGVEPRNSLVLPLGHPCCLLTTHAAS